MMVIRTTGRVTSTALEGTPKESAAYRYEEAAQPPESP